MENINNNLFKVFIALMIVTLCLGLFMSWDGLYNLRNNSDTLPVFFTVGFVGIFYFLTVADKWSWKSIVATSVAMPAMIIWLDTVSGFEPGLYPTTLVLGSVGLALGSILMFFNKFSVVGIIYTAIISIIAGIIISGLLWDISISYGDIIFFSLFCGGLFSFLKWIFIPMVVLEFKYPPSLPIPHP